MHTTNDFALSSRFWSVAAGCALVYGLLLVGCGAAFSDYAVNTLPKRTIVQDNCLIDEPADGLQAIAYSHKEHAKSR